MLPGQEAAVPISREQRLPTLGNSGKHDDERRQVGILRPEAVGNPRSHARPAADRTARLQERHGRIVVDRFGVHRADHGEPVHDAGELGQQFRDLEARIALPREGEVRAGEWKARLTAGHGRQPLHADDALGNLLAVVGLQPRLGIEEIHLRGPAGEKHEDHALGTGRGMAGGCEERRFVAASRTGEQRGECGRPETAGGVQEELPAAGRSPGCRHAFVVHRQGSEKFMSTRG